ncbi:MAG: topoisomerase DNA-binding C4 zinc finger domain-containing protein, partial [Clostridia bacterium]|nr:topoisomerase DNA-binding C4 zinc finger domain-containing protein [Clostridia bacterium]
SQMENADLMVETVSALCEGHLFRASGYTVVFPGFMAVYEETKDDAEEENNAKIPPLKKGTLMKAEKIKPEQHFTEPPARFTEASLIKFLEENGIGRPSTYTPIITTILSRGYAERSGKSLVPTQLGEVINEVMVRSFPDIIDEKFTASLETRLDEVENGKETMQQFLKEFYGPFEKELRKAEEEQPKERMAVPAEETDLICELCGAKMIVKKGRYGKFAACPNYPTCKNTKPLEEKKKEEKPLEIAPFKCEMCGADMVVRNGKFGSFYACSRYPACKFTKQKTVPLDVPCPKCGGELYPRFGKNRSQFYACSNYPKCDFSSWDRPVKEKCPKCGAILYEKKSRNLLVCKTAGCGYSAPSDGKENP